MQIPFLAWLFFIIAAVLEVSGDAIIRKGLRGSGLAIIAVGFIVLGCYGVVVNLVPWDFSRLLGVLCGSVRDRQCAVRPLRLWGSRTCFHVDRVDDHHPRWIGDPVRSHPGFPVISSKLWRER